MKMKPNTDNWYSYTQRHRNRHKNAHIHPHTCIHTGILIHTTPPYVYTHTTNMYTYMSHTCTYRHICKHIDSYNIHMCTHTHVHESDLSGQIHWNNAYFCSLVLFLTSFPKHVQTSGLDCLNVFAEFSVRCANSIYDHRVYLFDL